MNYQKLLSNGFLGCPYCIMLAFRYKGNLGRKIRYYRYANMTRKKGVAFFRIDRLATDYTNAYYHFSDMPKIERNWYIQNGFNPSKKVYCGLVPDNVNLYLSDFEFYRASNYKNLKSTLWFDNKLNTYYLLQPFVEYLPKHHYYIADGNIYPLSVETKHNFKVEDIMELIKEKAIAAKKCLGGHGDGFYKLEYVNGNFLINDKEISSNKLFDLLESLNGYIITDFIKPAKYLREIGGEDAFAVMRAMVIYDEVEGPQFERLMLRLGTTKSGHTQAGHDYLYIGIDDKGGFYNPLIELSDYDFEKIDKHPDTGKEILGNSLKNLDKLKSLVKEISGYLPTTPYLIFDIIPTEDSFSILEINSHGQPFNFEPFDPVKNSKYFRKLFNL